MKTMTTQEKCVKYDFVAPLKVHITISVCALDTPWYLYDLFLRFGHVSVARVNRC